MWGLILNELQRIIKRKSFLVAFIIYSVLTSLLIFVVYKEQQNATPAKIIQANENTIKAKKNSLKDTKVSTEARKAIEKDIKDIEKTNENLKAQQKHSDSYNWRKNIENNMKNNIKLTSKKEALTDDDKMEQLKSNIKSEQYILDNDIETQVIRFPSAAIIVVLILKFLGIVFVFAVVAINSSDIVAGEFSPPTAKMLLTKPVSRGKILFSKFVAACVSSIAIMIVIEVLAYLILGLIIGFGNSNMPTIIGTKYKYDALKIVTGGNGVSAVIGSSYLVKEWVLFLMVLGYQALYIVACTAICFLISTLSKSSVVAISTGLVVSMVISIVVQIGVSQAGPGGLGHGFVSKMYPYLIPVYGNPRSVLTGELSKTLNNPMVTPTFSIIVLLVWISVCYLISHLVFTKRDIIT